MYIVRLMGLFFAAGTLLLAFGWVGRDSLAELGLDDWDLPEYVRILASQDQRRASLEEKFSFVDERLRLKQQLAADLASGRLTLQEAANRLRPLMGSEQGEPWCALRRIEPAGTDDERLCRHLIDITRGLVERWGSAEEKRRLVQSLQAQLHTEMPQSPQDLSPVVHSLSETAVSQQTQYPPSRAQQRPGHPRRSGHARGNHCHIG